MPQGYTISAKPGAVNYIEGTVTLNGGNVSVQELRGVFLNAGDTLSTEMGKAEVLLTPGVFLRLGDNTQVRMVSPSLTDTQVELLRGEAMVEVDAIAKDNRILMLDHGANVVLEKSGLYRFTADVPPTAAVIFGKARVSAGSKSIEISKGNQALLTDQLTHEKFDAKKEDELFAWSNVRSEYSAASSYQTASSVSSMGFNSYGGSFGGFGPYGNNLMGSGWYWNSAFNSYSWLPGLGGAFYSPFGYGFYGTGLVGYAPVVRVPIGGVGPVRVVPVNGSNPPVFVHPRPPVGGQGGRFDHSTMSPAAFQAARAEAVRSFNQNGGFRTGTGMPAAAFNGGGGYRGGGAAAGGGYHGGGGNGGGGFHGAPSGGAAAASGGGGGHMSGGGGGAGAGRAK